jgi:cytoskeletal protein RodZ
MEKIRQVFLLIVLLFIVLSFSQINAESASSTINTQIHTSSTTSTKSTGGCHTKIHTDSNGKVQDYESDDCGSVTIHNDGTNVAVNTNTNNNSEPKATPTVTTKPTLTPTPVEKQSLEAAKMDKKMSAIKVKQRDFFKQIGDFIINLFAKLHL